MTRQFACPACGGMIDYPDIDKIIADYDVLDADEHYYEDAFEPELTVICDWCKKRVEVPLDLPEPDKLLEAEKVATITSDNTSSDRSAGLWPKTKAGRMVLLAMVLIMVIPSVIYAILVMIGNN
jgi:Zn-finger nucleic acid-binding protein